MKKTEKIEIYNTESKSLEPLCVIDKGQVGLYCCGPTVYNYAHIGNLRAYMFEDILRRTLEMAGYKVNHVMNVTDVGHLTDDGDDGEDKMIKSAREKGMGVYEIADFFTEAFFNDTKELNILKPSTVCRATKHIDEMLALIKRIEDNGFTYSAGGNIYFDTSLLSDYGRLAGLQNQELQAGARVKIDENKKNPGDFVLWFTAGKFEKQAMQWDSPWGRGYPGWHLECSAMSSKYLGEQFDIHCGGIDHIPVHHTNEIAQSEAAFGKKWVNYWLHNEFLLMKTGKMSKSKGNFLTLQSLKDEGFAPLDYRYFLLGAHYKTQLTFSAESLKAAKSARKKLSSRIEELVKLVGGNKLLEDGISEKTKEKLFEIKSFLFKDLNTPRALAGLWDTVKDTEMSPCEKLFIIEEIDRVLALDLTIVSGDLTQSDLNKNQVDEIEVFIAERIEAKKNKDYARSDEIRDLLLDKGIVLKDTPEGTKWEKR